MAATQVLQSERSELTDSLSRLDKAAEKLTASVAERPSGILKAKLVTFQDRLEDLNRSIDGICSEVAIDAELEAAAKLRDERAEIKKKAMADEAAAEARFNSAKFKIDAELDLDRSVRRQQREAEELASLRRDMDLRREARERAELLYSSDLASTLRRLRTRESDLERLRREVGSSYEKRRLHDAIRRIRVGRLALSEQISDYDYRGRRLASLLDLPPLYDGLATRYYSSLYPYYRYYPGTGYPYYYGYGYPYY